MAECKSCKAEIEWHIVETATDSIVVFGEERRRIYQSPTTGRWEAYGHAGIDFPTKEAAANYIVNQLSLPGVFG